MASSLSEPGRLAWILGSSRSGSTWLLRMLSGLPGVAPLDDPHLGHHLAPWRPIPLAWATADEPQDLATLRDFKREEPDYFFADEYRDAWLPPLRALITARFEAQLRRDGADEGAVAVVKEPASQSAPLLLDAFPHSSIIFLLRDGRDVVDSWLDAYSRGSWASAGGAYPVAKEGRLALVKWQSAVWLHRTEVVQRVFDQHPQGRRILVRYEDLRADPGTGLAEVAAVLGLDAGAEARAVAEENDFDRVPPGERGSGKMIRSAKPGGWQSNMTAAEIDAMHEILGPKLEELGYLEPVPARAAS